MTLCPLPPPRSLIKHDYVNCFFNAIKNGLSQFKVIDTASSAVQGLNAPCDYLVLVPESVAHLYTPEQLAALILSGELDSALPLDSTSTNTVLKALSNFKVPYLQVSPGEYVEHQHFNTMIEALVTLASAFQEALEYGAKQKPYYVLPLAIAKTCDEVEPFTQGLPADVDQFVKNVYSEYYDLVSSVLKEKTDLDDTTISRIADNFAYAMRSAAASSTAFTQELVYSSIPPSSLPCVRTLPGYACFVLPTGQYDISCVPMCLAASLFRLNMLDKRVIDDILALKRLTVKSGDVISSSAWREVISKLDYVIPSGSCFSGVPICIKKLTYSPVENDYLAKLSAYAQNLRPPTPLSYINVPAWEAQQTNPQLADALEVLYKEATEGNVFVPIDVLASKLRWYLDTAFHPIVPCDVKAELICLDYWYDPSTGYIMCKQPTGTYPLCKPQTFFVEDTVFGNDFPYAFVMASEKPVDYSKNYREYVCRYVSYFLGLMSYDKCMNDYPDAVGPLLAGVNVVAGIGLGRMYGFFCTLGCYSACFYYPFVVACRRSYGNCIKCWTVRAPELHGFELLPQGERPATTVKALEEIGAIYSPPLFYVGPKGCCYETMGCFSMKYQFTALPASAAEKSGEFELCYYPDEDLVKVTITDNRRKTYVHS